MAYEEALRTISLDADASVGFYTGVPGQPGSPVPHGGQIYRIVKVTGVHQVGLATSAGDKPAGIVQNKPQQEKAAATVAIGGVSLLVAGGNIDAGDLVASDGEGRGIKATAADEVVGTALSAGAAGHLVSVLIG